MSAVLKKSTPGKFAYTCHFQQIGINAAKIEKKGIQFKADVFAAVAVVDAKGGGHDTFVHRSHAKKSEYRLFPDWIGNNTDNSRCSDWPKRRHPLIFVDFSLHFACVMSS